MINYSSFFFSLMSISAVLLSLSATQRSSAFSSLASGNVSGVTLGDVEYKQVLDTIGERTQKAGFLFVVVTVLSLVGYALVSIHPGFMSTVYEQFKWADGYATVVTTLFFAGLLYLAGSLTVGHEFNMPVGISFRFPIKVNTPEESGVEEGGRPETVDADDPVDNQSGSTIRRPGTAEPATKDATDGASSSHPYSPGSEESD